jgi:hypothetical protein
MPYKKRNLLAAFGVAAAVAAVAAVPALAKNPHTGTQGNSANAKQHVTICHAAPPDTFPAKHYVRISPSASGVYHGHLRQHDADIIPPFVYNGVTYSENWDATGQAIWNNGCVAPDSTTTTDTTTTTTTTTTGSTTSGVAGASVTKGGVKAVTHSTTRAKPAAAAASFTG